MNSDWSGQCHHGEQGYNYYSDIKPVQNIGHLQCWIKNVLHVVQVGEKIFIHTIT